MVRATLSNRRKNGTNHEENVNTNHHKEDKHTKNLRHTLTAFNSLDFKIPSFKKKANDNSPLNKHQNPTLSLNHNGLKKTIKTLLKQNKDINQNINNIINSNESSILPFTKIYRNKPRQNYTNKSSHLSLTNLTKFKSKLIDDDNDIDDNNKTEMNGYHEAQPQSLRALRTKNHKKAKRAQRRKQLKQQIAKVTTEWKMDHNHNGNTSNNNNHQNGNGHLLLMNDANVNVNDNDDNHSLLNMNAMNDIRESLRNTETEIVKERKKITNNSRLIETDRNNLTALFKNDLFDSNPIKFTKEILRKQSNALNMKSDAELKQLQMNGVNDKRHKKINGFHHNHHHHHKNHKNDKNQNKKRRNNHNHNNDNNHHRHHHHHRNQSQMNDDEEITQQITKQLIASKKQMNQTHRSKLKLSSSSKHKKDAKIRNGPHLNGKKPGKFIGKKLKKKMSESDKFNQKKRRWRA